MFDPVPFKVKALVQGETCILEALEGLWSNFAQTFIMIRVTCITRISSYLSLRFKIEHWKDFQVFRHRWRIAYVLSRSTSSRSQLDF